MQLLCALDQHLFGLGNFRIGDAAVDRTYCGALLLIEEADALGALVGHDVIDVLLNRTSRLAVKLPRRAAFIDRGVGAFGLAGPAVDALFGYDSCHLVGPKFSGNDARVMNDTNGS